MKDLRKEADEIYQEFADSLFSQFKKERYGIGCHLDGSVMNKQNRKVLLDWQMGVYDAIFDRLSCQGGDGACDTKVNTAVAFFGWLVDPSILSSAEAIQAASMGNAFYTRGGTIKCDYTPNGVPQILWMAELATEPVKTRYVVKDGLEGNIGNPDTDLFGAPVVIGIYRLYTTSYPTQQSEDLIAFKVPL